MTAAEIFAAHAAGCARCSRVVFSKPATFAETCLEGASLALEAARELARAKPARNELERSSGRRA